MSGYEVVSSELTAHAGAVRKVADALGQAVEAAGQVTVGVQAYGMITGPLFVPIVMAVSAPGLLTLRMAQQAVTDVANEVEATAEQYAAVEKSTANSFTALHGRLS
ncbi:type VII secretion target [Lentzea sp.]|uniref:type VII secretion target n=1 Tax=Lentzea sp. TaxID=56099 RepID=UPI002ED62038